MTQLVPLQAVRTLAAINLLSPHIPSLFMGEEWAARQPFMFFSDVGEDLADTIRESRKKELKDIPMPEGAKPPDPMSEATFHACKLDWDSVCEEASVRHLSLYRRLIALRQKEIVPRLHGMEGHSARFEVIGRQAIEVVWTLGDKSELSLLANLSAEPLEGVSVWGADHLWLEGFATGDSLDAWSVVFRLGPAEKQVWVPMQDASATRETRRCP